MSDLEVISIAMTIVVVCFIVIFLGMLDDWARGDVFTSVHHLPHSKLFETRAYSRAGEDWFANTNPEITSDSGSQV